MECVSQLVFIVNLLAVHHFLQGLPFAWKDFVVFVDVDEDIEALFVHRGVDGHRRARPFKIIFVLISSALEHRFYILWGEVFVGIDGIGFSGVLGDVMANTFHDLMEHRLGLFLGSELIDRQVVVTTSTLGLLAPECRV